jgi:ubiquinone/menaquinone biosynthesis C-methylase UbiE
MPVCPGYTRLVHWAFERLYREFAWSYDLVAAVVSRGCWNDWVASSLPFVEGRVLEIGFGPGHLLARLAGSAPVYGIDPSLQMLALARRRLGRSAGAPYLLQSVAQALPFSSEAFDTVVATFPTDYILDPVTHREIERVLARNGRLVLVLSATLVGNGFYERLVALAYRLTGQSASAAESAAPAGLTHTAFQALQLHPHTATVGSSRVFLLIGQRSDSAATATNGCGDASIT